MTSRNYVFTLNNYSSDEEKYIQSIRNVRFVGYAREEGELNGTKHLQGVVCFQDPRKLKQVIKLLPRAHVEVMKGTFAQAWTSYIETGHGGKKPVPTEVYKWGDAPIPPGKNLVERHEHAWECALANKLEEIPKDLRLRYYHTLNSLAAKHAMVPDLDDVTGVWVYGPTNAGKSHYVRANYGEHTRYDKKLNRFWDHYIPGFHTCAWLDDLDLSHDWLAYDLNRWADKYAFTAEVKGSYTKIRPPAIVVTSRYTIDEIFWNKDQSTRDSLNRRFKVVIPPPKPLAK